ncbi:hypothetical protein ACHAW6_008465 [Cyclotella cf. meneghiniana]
MDKYFNQNNCKSSIGDEAESNQSRHLSSYSRPLPDMKQLRRFSSSQTVASNASSTRTHRRSCVEVGSMIFDMSVQDTSSLKRQTSNPLPIQRITAMHHGHHRSSSLEHRAADEDSEPAFSCASDRVARSDRVSSSSFATTAKQDKDHETECCTLSKEEDGTLDDTVRALELIRKLSFETGDANAVEPTKRRAERNSTVSVCSAPTILAVPRLLDRDRINRRERDEGDVILASTPPPGLPLPPKIQRMEDAHSVVSLPYHIPQIMHSRNRLRSTSLSEMSDSCRLGFDVGKEEADEDEQQGACSMEESSVLYSAKSRVHDEEIVLSTIENGISSASMALSPPLHPLLIQPRTPLLLNRGRTSTMASDQSSYLSPCSSSSSSSSSNNKDISDEYSISSYEEELHGLDDPPGFYEGDFRSEPWHRDAGNLLPQDSSGIHIHHSGWGKHSQDPQRLSCEALREWNRLCEEEENQQGIATKHQHIWRALSCPDMVAWENTDEQGVENVFNINALPEDVPTHLISQTGFEDVTKDNEHAVSPEVPPHLVGINVPMSDAPSRSIFSYTNSYSPSTISSELTDVEERSQLDFDITFIYPREIEVAHSPDTADVKNAALPLQKQGHRRSQSSIGPSKPLNAKKTFAGTKRRHRRYKSDNVLVDTALSSSDAPLHRQDHRLSLPNIAEDKSSNCFSNVNSSDNNLLNVLSLSLRSDEMNVSSIKELIAKACERNGEKIFWFTFGIFFAVSFQYLFRV